MWIESCEIGPSAGLCFCVRQMFSWIWFLQLLDHLSSALVHSSDCYNELLIEANLLFEASRLGRKFLFNALRDFCLFGELAELDLRSTI